MRLVTAIVAAVSFLTAIFNLQSVSAADYRLSKDVLPLKYNITITPYFLPEDGDRRFTFSGETSIHVNVRNTGVREFAVHADYLDFAEVNMWSEDGKDLEVTTSYEAITDKLFIQLTEELSTSVNYTLSFKYTGRISSGYDGLYRMSYNDTEGNEKWMIATQLQRIDARKLFPCFDEPSFKAFFDIHISRPKGFSSFSNAALFSTTIDQYDENRFVDHFDTTPYMSTYLVAVVVSEFKARGENDLFIVARPEFFSKTEFSYQVSRKILDGYSELFGISYKNLGNPLLQKAALPKFIHNGMENWGLMIYKEDVLIFEDGFTDLSGMQYTTTIISHETSHSWFGDAVTFDWWGYFWLNEGFARYYQYFFTHKLYPQYDLDKQFITDQLHYIFNVDALNSSQPLSEPSVASPSEIARKFSGITYVKGASVLRMISNAMSEELFEHAVKDYLKNNLNRSVVPSDLLKYLEIYWPKSPAVDVEELFYDWTDQPGFPLLTVTLAEDNLSVSVKQKRYLLNSNDGSDPNLRYTIPITYATSREPDFDNTRPSVYFNKSQEEINFHFIEPVEWVMFNVQQTGYYRVMYETRIWNNLHSALFSDSWSGIHEINRAQFVDDLFAFAKASLLEYDSVFIWLEYLETETHYTPWQAAFDGFSFVSAYLTVEEHIDFGKYMLFVTEKVFNEVGVDYKDSDTVLETYNRKKILNYNCKYGRQDCVSKVQSILREFLFNDIDIQVDMRSTVYCSGMRDGSETDFDKLLEKFKAQVVRTEKLRMRYGLGCGRDSKNMAKFFDFVLSDEVPVAEKEGAMAPLYKENHENVWPAFEMLTSRFEEVAEAFESWSTTADLISSIATLLTTPEQREAFAEFIKENGEKFGSSSGTLENALKKLDTNLEWAESRLGSLKKYLRARNSARVAAFINIYTLMVAVLSYFLI